MRGFNLSRFAVGHPTLILFFILMLAAAGAHVVHAARAGGGSGLHDQGRRRLGAVAGRHRGGDARPGRRPDREEAAGAGLLRQGRDLHHVGLHGGDGDLPRQHAAEAGAGSLLPDPQEARRPQAQPAAGRARAAGQRRVRRRLLGPLHADRRRARARPAQGLRRGHPPAAARRARREQGRPDRLAGAADLRRVQPRQARDPRHRPAGDLRQPGAAERGHAGGRASRPRRPRSRSGSPGRSTGSPRSRPSRWRSATGCSASATSRR